MTFPTANITITTAATAQITQIMMTHLMSVVCPGVVGVCPGVAGGNEALVRGPANWSGEGGVRAPRLPPSVLVTQ